MSHFTTIATEIRDLKACEEALEEMGLKLLSKGECRYYFGEQFKENVVKLPGKYDMALEKQQDDTYLITADFYMGDVEKTIGDKGCILLEKYAEKALRKKCKEMHLSFSKIETNSFKVRDPKDSAGGYMIVTFDDEGNVSFKPKGFKGKKCAKFLQLEDALGRLIERKFLPEYYKDREVETIKNERIKERLRV